MTEGTGASGPPPARARRIAAIITEYRPLSHADVIVGKYLEGYRQDGLPPRPASQVVSMYTDQVPENDMSRDLAQWHGIVVFPTVQEALTLGTADLAVDGVLLIGEHGDYPLNAKGQKLYPRHRLFMEIAGVFRRTGRSVPVFNDKHLSCSWQEAREMVDTARLLEAPFMAGSSVPVAHRKPPVDVPHGAILGHAVAVGYGGIESYGFHMLEALQCLVERRAGGETGVDAVQCLKGEAVWSFVDETEWASRLLAEALARSETRRPGDPRRNTGSPAAFLVDYRDGLRAAGFILDGHVQDFTAAAEMPGRPPVSTLMWLQHGRPHHHFACLVRNIEEMFETGRPPYPVERTLLTSGILDFALESRFRGHTRLETPELEVCYRVADRSFFSPNPPPFTTWK